MKQMVKLMIKKIKKYKKEIMNKNKYKLKQINKKK